jgi:Ca-activated chloride channel homolog
LDVTQEEVMKPQIRTTAALLGAAGAFVTAAVLFEGGPSASTTTPKRVDAPTPPPTAACTTQGTAHGTAKAGLTKLDGNLSAGSILRGGGGELHASFEITTENVAGLQRPPLNLAVVIDRSGSMSDGRIENAQKAALGIVERLGATDRVALVQYDDSADVLVPSIAMDVEGKTKLRTAIRNIQLGGSTNLHGGLALGRDEVRRTFQGSQVSRVILLSDGQANAGIVDPRQIADTARMAANQGVRITSVGIGLDYNEDLMEAIAEAGRGQYHFVKVASDLDKVIAGELSSVQGTVATNVELHLKAPCVGVEVAGVLGYESRRDGDTLIVPMADLSGGDSRKLLVSLKIPDGERGVIGAIHGELVFRDAKGGELQRTAVALGVDRVDDKQIAIGSANKDVMAQVIEVEAATTMRAAAASYEKGDRAEALRSLELTKHEIQRKSAMYKIAPAASASALGELEVMASDAKAYDPSSDEGKMMLKSSKARARVMSKKK